MHSEVVSMVHGKVVPALIPSRWTDLQSLGQMGHYVRSIERYAWGRAAIEALDNACRQLAPSTIAAA